MRALPLRLRLVALAIAGGWLLAACDDADEVSGVGAQVGLPAPFVSNTTNPTDVGVGNVHWVGNPRW